jgi:Subtilase family
MTNAGGRSLPEAFPGRYDGHPPITSSAEHDGIARQRRALGQGGAGGPWPPGFISTLRQRRRGAQLVQFEPVRSDGLDAPVVSELLIRAADYDGTSNRPNVGRVRQIANRHNLAPSAVQDLRGQLIRLRADNLRASDLVDIAREIRGIGKSYNASVAHITPLGYVLKGGSAGPTIAAAGLPNFASAQCPHPTTVAVIDTGVTSEVRADGWLAGLPDANTDNVDLLNVFPAGHPDQYLDAGAGHGSFVAGVVKQIAPAANLRVYKAVDSDGVGSEVDVAAAMVRAVTDGARIINLSLGCETIDNQPLLSVEVALDLIFAQAPDTLVVASAGNNGDAVQVWPAASPRVVAVAALDANEAGADWSTHGSWVECSTIGEGILSTFVEGQEDPALDPDAPDTFPADSWARWSGTSFTSAQITGAVAERCCQSGLSPRDELAALLAPAPEIPDYGKGLRVLPGV